MVLWGRFFSRKSETVTVEPKEKIGIYMKDWYLELNEYIDYLKRK